MCYNLSIIYDTSVIKSRGVTMELPKVGFIGAGKVGITLGRYFAENEIPIIGFYSKTETSSKQAAYITGSKSLSLEEVIQASNLLFITVPDFVLPEVWERVRTFNLEGKEVCHCSGSLTSFVFNDIEFKGAKGFSLHPLCAIHDLHSSYMKMEAVHFTLEGPKSGKYLLNLLRILDNPVEHIAPENKVLYHTAAVFCSNLVIGLAKMGSDLLKDSGLSDEFALHAWRGLFERNAQNIVERGLIPSLTGPIERGDDSTVKSHLSSLHGSHLQVYQILSQELIALAKEKHPERDFSNIEEVLKR